MDQFYSYFLGLGFSRSSRSYNFKSQTPARKSNIFTNYQERLHSLASFLAMSVYLWKFFSHSILWLKMQDFLDSGSVQMVFVLIPCFIWFQGISIHLCKANRNYASSIIKGTLHTHSTTFPFPNGFQSSFWFWLLWIVHSQLWLQKNIWTFEICHILSSLSIFLY